MKNKKIIRSLNTIIPSKSQKEKMLAYILEPKKHHHKNWKIFYQLGMVMSVLVISFVLIGSQIKQEQKPAFRDIPVPTKFSITRFYQDSSCYMATSTFVDKDKVGKYLFTVSVGDQETLKRKVYEYLDVNDKSAVVLEMNHMYEVYQLCMEERK